MSLPVKNKRATGNMHDLVLVSKCISALIKIRQTLVKPISDELRNAPPTKCTCKPIVYAHWFIHMFIIRVMERTDEYHNSKQWLLFFILHLIEKKYQPAVKIASCNLRSPSGRWT